MCISMIYKIEKKWINKLQEITKICQKKARYEPSLGKNEDLQVYIHIKEHEIKSRDWSICVEI